MTLGEREKVELVERYFDAFNRGDLAALRSLSHPDIVVEPPGETWAPGFQVGPRYRGVDAIERLVETIRAGGGERIRIEGSWDAGQDALLLQVTLIGRPPGQTQPIGGPIYVAVRFSEGRISYFGGSETREKAEERLAT